MTKKMELLGLGFVVIMFVSFTGLLQPTVEPGLSPLFWGCAGGALMIIIFRKIKKKQEGEE